MKTYLKFIELKPSVKFFCDHDAEKILEEIAIKEAQGNPMTVTGVMEMGFVSAATAFRKLGGLRNVGYVKAVYGDLDKRTKFLKITPMAKSYLSALEATMNLAKEQTK